MAAGSNPLRNHPRYEFVKELGSGAFGKVICARDQEQENKLVAIKLLNRGNTITDYVETELLNHRLLWHPHVIRYLETFLTNQHLCIVLEYAEQGDLFSFVVKHKALSEKLARWLFQQHIIALDYLHRKNVCARDIKLENTLLAGKNAKDPLIKICDLGYSKHILEQSQPNTQVGTPGYMAPEILNSGQRQPGQDYGYDGRSADIWSSGVMLYTMLRGRYPFERPEDNKMTPMAKSTAVVKRILACDVDYPDTMSDSAKDLLQRMITLHPKHRITLPEIQQHPWFAQKLPNGVLRMNEPLLEHEIPREVLQHHAQELHKLVVEATRRLPYTSNPIPYIPLPTPQAQPKGSFKTFEHNMSQKAIESDQASAQAPVRASSADGAVNRGSHATGQQQQQPFPSSRPPATHEKQGPSWQPPAGVQQHGTPPVTSFMASLADQNQPPNGHANAGLQRGTPAAGGRAAATNGAGHYPAGKSPAYTAGGGYTSSYEPNMASPRPPATTAQSGQKGFKSKLQAQFAAAKAGWHKLLHK